MKIVYGEYFSLLGYPTKNFNDEFFKVKLFVPLLTQPSYPQVQVNWLKAESTLVANTRKLSLHLCLCINCYNIKIKKATEKQ